MEGGKGKGKEQQQQQQNNNWKVLRFARKDALRVFAGYSSRPANHQAGGLPVAISTGYF